MEKDRREFLKIGGISVLGLSALPVFEALAQGQGPKAMPDPRALQAGQWAMVVDMKKCWEEQEKRQCKDCMDACHKIHNVPTIPDPKREIKWIWMEEYKHAFPDQANEFAPEHVKENSFMLLCNHCTNPPCVQVCPTKATFKRAEDGVVMMDFHRCIGCRYCMAGCPYGARSFNWGDPREYLDPQQINQAFPTRRKGVVEKCNFCAERLAQGLPPACVEACKAKALVYGDVTDPESEVRKILAEQYTLRRKIALGTGPNVYYII
ncbi:MAG: 4Fe-4S dicluster protein [Desulfacinum sp.]|jgi:molybdopterin-containing oxidoreductase family iron-sulfur binding subunit|nr:4Fe-4S dicluster protein [Desulfacinum sp.]